MHIDLLVALASLVVGFVVGLTGMGGGALMTPILVLLFGIQPLAAVASDLVASFVMKPVGGGVHLRKGTVNRPLVRWLVTGSVPSAFAGVLLIRAMGGDRVESRVKLALGVALLIAAVLIVVKSVLQARRARSTEPPAQFKIRPAATMAVGALGGLVVGMTSVGSGSLIIVMLLFLYPSLQGAQLVGTDLVQAVPLVGAAALGHILFGDFKLGLTASLLIGALPGVYVGAHASARAPDRVIRPVLTVVLTASALKLIGLGTAVVGIALIPIAGGAALWAWKGAGLTAQRPNDENLIGLLKNR
ncbi:MAG: sulfite exporter TauE/SafE family protein [Actinobacteria bacterium]|nr:sulfite exporter TauE/SafE family protein [Actinomycetota bacterium]